MLFMGEEKTPYAQNQEFITIISILTVETKNHFSQDLIIAESNTSVQKEVLVIIMSKLLHTFSFYFFSWCFTHPPPASVDSEMGLFSLVGESWLEV